MKSQLTQRNQDTNNRGEMKLHSNINMKKRINQQQEQLQNNRQVTNSNLNPLINASSSKWASDQNMEYRDGSTQRGKSSQRQRLKNSIEQSHQDSQVIIGEDVIENQPNNLEFTQREQRNHLTQRPNRKLIQLGNNISKFVGQSSNQPFSKKSEQTIEQQVNQNNILNENFAQKNLPIKQQQQKQFVISNNAKNKIKFFPQNNQQYHYKRRSEASSNLRGQRASETTVESNDFQAQQKILSNFSATNTSQKNQGNIRMNRSNLMSNLQNKITQDMSYRSNQIVTQAQKLERYSTTARQRRRIMECQNMSLELSTERKSQIRESELTTYKPNNNPYDSLNMKQTGLFGNIDLEEMHHLKVKQYLQLKSVEQKTLFDMIESKFYEDQFIIDNDNLTVLPIDSELDLDD
eukprot:403360649